MKKKKPLNFFTPKKENNNGQWLSEEGISAGFPSPADDFKEIRISLDKELNNENHKSLLRQDNSTPLSGTFYFLPIVLLLFYNLDLQIIVCCSLLFLLGLFADLKILTSYKLRLCFQFLFISSLFLVSEDIKIDTRILFINDLMNYDLTRILICTFFFMVLDISTK